MKKNIPYKVHLLGLPGQIRARKDYPELPRTSQDYPALIMSSQN